MFFGFAEAGSNPGYSGFDHGMFMSGAQVDLIGQTHRLSPARAIRFQITELTLSYRSLLPRHRDNERPGATGSDARLGLTEELANAIVFIASDEASFITGHVLNVDGGHTAG